MLSNAERWDQPILDYLAASGLAYVDTLQAAADEYRNFSIPVADYIARHYVGRAGAQVFGHYNAAGNFWFAHTIRDALVDWLDPKPMSYR